MPKSRRIFFLLLSAAAVAVLFVLLMSGPQNALRQWRQLPNGARIRILDTPYGRTNYSYVNLKKPWRFLEFAMPERIARKLGIIQSGLRTTSSVTNELCFVVDQDGIPSTAYTGYVLVALGKHEEQYGVEWRGGRIGSNDRMTILGMPIFPRREKLIRVALRAVKDDGSRSNITEFKIPNPVSGPFPVWQPERLPVTKTNSDLKVTLVSFTPARAVFQIEQGVVTNSPWHFRALDLTDATGNLWKPSGWESNFSVARKGLEEEVTYRGGLGLDEPAWKVRAEYHKQANFTSDESVEIGPVPVPAPGAGIKFDLVTNWHGTPLTISGVRSRSVRPPGINVSSKQTYEYMVAYLPERYDGIGLKLIKVTDDQQREVKTGVDLEVENWISFGLDIPPDAKQLHLTFALSKNRFFDFFVKPTVAWQQ